MIPQIFAVAVFKIGAVLAAGMQFVGDGTFAKSTHNLARPHFGGPNRDGGLSVLFGDGVNDANNLRFNGIRVLRFHRTHVVPSKRT
jgi:hypothetical protein